MKSIFNFCRAISLLAGAALMQAASHGSDNSATWFSEIRIIQTDGPEADFQTARARLHGGRLYIHGAIRRAAHHRSTPICIVVELLDSGGRVVASGKRKVSSKGLGTVDKHRPRHAYVISFDVPSPAPSAARVTIEDCRKLKKE